MQRIIKTNVVNLDVSGNDGQNGFNGNHGVNEVNDARIHGHHGSNGAHGENAANVELTMTTDEVNGDVYAVVANRDTYQLPIGAPDASINIKARGGNGGKGGQGGHGGYGRTGRYGEIATLHSNATNGGPGSHGGNGGDGGHGGNAGNGGNVIVKVSQQDIDLLRLIGNTNLCFGIYGTGGAGGNGGQGGPGGAGGEGGIFHRAETTHSPSTGYPQTVYISVHRQFAFQGRSGDNGRPGLSGRNGNEGGMGKIIYVVGNQTYHDVYHLNLCNFQEIQNDDGIFEPGDMCELRGVTFENIGVMPTPAQPIFISLMNNKWIHFIPEDKVKLKSSIAQHETEQLDRPLRFFIRRNLTPAIDATFAENAELQLNGMLTRVNRNIDIRSSKFANIQIRYPVEISKIELPTAIEKNHPAPFSIAIRNISGNELGINSSSRRKVNVEISAITTGADYLRLLGRSNLPDVNLTQPFIQEVEMLSGGEMSIISGSFMFPENASRYSEANISFKLHIADQYSPHDMNVIQVRNTHINVSAQFQYHPDALFTLVVNKEVSPQIIDQWQALADQLGMRMNIWDSSLYHGFSYTRLLHNGRSLAELMKNKVVVILDNNFALDGVFTCSTRLLDEIEMMRAANKFGVATYVIGNMLDLRRSLTPMEPIEEFNQGQLAQKWCLHSNNLTENDTKNIAAEFTTNIQKQNPFVRYVPLYTYQPERDRIATNSFKKRSLGGVEARQTLKLSRAYIAQRNTQTMNPDTLKDAFSILKLLPMNVKLNYLHHANNKLSELSASYAILSDLLDEIKAAARFKWNGGFIEQTLLYCLVNFRHLREGANQVTKHLPYILLNYEYVVCRLTDNYDEYLFPFFRRCIMLKKIILKAVEMQLNEHFANRTFNEERNYIKQQWDKISLDQVFANIVRIPDSTTTFDNQVDFDAPVSLFGLFPKYVKKQSNFQESADLPDNAVQEKKNYTF